MDYWRRNMNKCCVKCVNDKTVKHISFDNNGQIKNIETFSNIIFCVNSSNYYKIEKT